MSGLRPRSAVALVAWTLLTWIGRVPLLWGDDEQSTAAKLGSSVPVVVFVGLALAAVVVLVRRGPWTHVAAVLAVWSVGYWAVRYPLILANDHPAAFMVVHGVLAAVAIGLSVWTLVDLRSAAPRRARV
jgi:hypothetical protein